MAINTDNIQTFTDAELLAIARSQLAAAMVAQNYSVNGRQMNKARIESLKETIAWLEERIENASTETGGNIALARFGETT